MEQTVRRLTRSRRDRVFAGICGGLAAYLGVDPVLVRVLYVALTLLSWGMGIVLYLLAWIIIPLEGENAASASPARDDPARRDARRIAGVFLVILGLLALLSTTFGWFHVFTNLRLMGPIVLLAFGIALLMWRTPKAASGDRTGEGSPGGPMGSPIGHQLPGQAPRPRRLMRSDRGRKLAGVCAGLGEYLNVDATIVRLLFIAAIFAGGAGVILYVIMWLVVPLDDDVAVPRIGT